VGIGAMAVSRSRTARVQAGQRMGWGNPTSLRPSDRGHVGKKAHRIPKFHFTACHVIKMAAGALLACSFLLAPLSIRCGIEPPAASVLGACMGGRHT
jgi:hypothetical protein